MKKSRGKENSEEIIPLVSCLNTKLLVSGKSGGSRQMCGGGELALKERMKESNVKVSM